MKPDPYQFFADQTGVTPLMVLAILLLVGFVLIARSLVNKKPDQE